MSEIQLISQRVLESEQRDFFLNLVFQLPENIKTIAERPTHMSPWQWKIWPVGGRVTALVCCANCKKEETSEKEFPKCSRCSFVHYCSKACQKADWQSHKQICK